jgi:anti-sigma factor RsiW
MDCDEIKELLATYLDNELEDNEKLNIESHLSACRKCREELEGLALMREQLRKVFKIRANEVSPSPQTWDKVKQRIIVPGHMSFWEWLINSTRSPVWRTVTPVVLIIVMAIALWQTGTFSLKGSSKSISSTSPVVSEKTLDSNYANDGQTRQAAESTDNQILLDGGSSNTTQVLTTGSATYGVASIPPGTLTTTLNELAPASKGATSGLMTPVNPIYDSPEKIINLKSGESFSIGLNVTLRLGPKWQLIKYDNTALALNPNSIYIDDNPENPGLGGTQYFIFTGIKAGLTTIEFNLSLGTDASIIQNSVFTVEIK